MRCPNPNPVVRLLPVDTVVVSDATSFIQSLPDSSVDLVMTSPPYWNLRNYGVEGQIGLEHHPLHYVRRTAQVFHGIKWVLMKEGSLYLNIGDSYFGSGTHGPCEKGKGLNWRAYLAEPKDKEWGAIADRKWLQHKQLLGIPERVMTALQEDGWILRNKIIWWKRNHIPSPVKDRLACAYEFVYHFVKSRRYYYDLDSIRTPLKESTRERMKYPFPNRGKAQLYVSTGQPGRTLSEINRQYARRIGSNPKGANPSDVWDVTLKPFHGPHFAVYPPDLCVRPILSSCPPGSLVLDPFAGSGTTLCVAKALGRRYLGCDLNPSYVEMTAARLEDVKSPVAPITRLPEGLSAVKGI